MVDIVVAVAIAAVVVVIIVTVVNSIRSNFNIMSSKSNDTTQSVFNSYYVCVCAGTLCVDCYVTAVFPSFYLL